MKKLLETLGFVLAVVGAAGLVHQMAGWFRLWAIVRRIPLLRDHQLPTNLSLLAAGLVLLVVADGLRTHRAR